MESYAERQPDATDGDNWQPQDDLVAVPTGSCLESSDSLQGGAPEMRLSGVRWAGEAGTAGALRGVYGGKNHWSRHTYIKGILGARYPKSK